MKISRYISFTALLATMALSACSGGGFLGIHNPLHPARPEDNPGGTTVPYVYGFVESLARAQHWLFWLSGIAVLLTVALAVLALKFMPLLAFKVARDGAIASVGLFIAGLVIKPVVYVCLFAAIAGLVYMAVRVAWNWKKKHESVGAAVMGEWDKAIALWKGAHPDDYKGPNADVAARADIAKLVNP